MITNAVINPGPAYSVSEDGYETQFSGDHLAHFILIKHIFPLVLKARTDTYKPRIVAISSIAHAFGTIHLDDLTFKDGKEYSTIAGYANAKSANLLFAKELAKRVEGKGVLAFAVHPGGECGSSLDSGLPPTTVFVPNSHLDQRLRRNEQGAETNDG